MKNKFNTHCLNWLIIILLSGWIFSACAPASDQGQGIESIEAEEDRMEQIALKLEEDPENPSLYHERSGLYLSAQELNRALSDINQAIQLDEENAEYFITLSDIYLGMGKIGSCLDALQKAEALDPENTGGLLKQAEVYLVLREYSKSFDYIQRVLDIDKFNPVAYFIAGYAMMETGDTASAVRNFIIATEQDQAYYQAYMQLGHLYAMKQDPLALGYFNNAINARPNDPEAWYSVGMFYQGQEEISQAIQAYERLLAIDPDYSEAYYNLGYLHLVYLNDFGQAALYFSSTIERNEKNVDAWFNRGYSYELAGDYIAARADYKKCTTLEPGYERAVEGLNRLDRAASQ